MNETLYFVANSGCDATTYGLVRLGDDEFVKFKTFVKNLNRNSSYRCMPVISVYKIDDPSVLREIDYRKDQEFGDDDYVDPDHVFYLDGKTYTFAEEYFMYYNELELVI